MSEHEEQSKGFKVTDRRSFTSEGERITKSEEEPELVDSRGASLGHEPREPRPRAEATGQLEPRFLDLLSLLATQASFALGAPNPVTGESHEDLETARVMISMLEVLKAKTKGNLVGDEDTALDEILYQLRMEFMARAKGTKR